MGAALSSVRAGLRQAGGMQLGQTALAAEAVPLAQRLGAGLQESEDGVVIGLAGRLARDAEIGSAGRAPRPVLAPGAAEAAPGLARAVGEAVAAVLRDVLGGR